MRVVRAIAVKSACLLALLMVCGVLCGQGRASDLSWPCRQRCVCPTCPDDYCRKPLPAIAQLKYCGPDDYCKKPLPNIFRFTWCGPDDYCKKPLPTMPHCYPPWYTCGPDCGRLP